MKLAPVFLAVFGLALPTLAQTVIYPTGDPTQDVPAVRAAAQAGGTVLLKAVDVAGEPQVFDFSDFPVGAIDWNEEGSGYVALGTSGEEILVVPVGNSVALFVIGHDVHLLGETVGETKTTIRGGTIPIRNFGPFRGTSVNVFGLANITVEGVRFTESALQSVYLSHLTAIPEVRAALQQLGLDLALELKDNEFVDVQPAFAGLWYGLGAYVDGSAGPVRLQGNVVRFTPGRFAAEQRAFELENNLGQRPDSWEGLTIADLHAPGEVTGNRVENADVGLHVWLTGADQVRIADNDVTLRPEGFYGIAAEANHTYVIERNTVLAPGPFPDGISLWSTDQQVGINHSTIRHNRIVMDGSNFGGITLYSGGSENIFSQNVVEGSAAYALGLASPFLPAAFFSTGNILRGNQIQRFTPRDSVFWGSGVHVLFDANTIGNVFLGRSGIVKDLGVGNSATGVTHRGRGPHPALRFRAAAKRDRLRPLRPAWLTPGEPSEATPPSKTVLAPAEPVTLRER